MISELNNILKDSESLPFLFVGSGFSKRYLDTPDWKDLLKSIAYKIDNDPFYFSKLERIVSQKYDETKEFNNYMTMLCDLISNDLNNIWYSHRDFEHNRVKYKNEVINKKLEPIKIEIAELIREKSIVNDLYEQELNILEEITYKSVSGLITTNYDQLLEDYFKFQTYNSQDELFVTVK